MFHAYKSYHVIWSVPIITNQWPCHYYEHVDVQLVSGVFNTRYLKVWNLCFSEATCHHCCSAHSHSASDAFLRTNGGALQTNNTHAYSAGFIEYVQI